MCWTHTHMWCLAYLNFLWRTEVSYLEKQRDKMVSVCDWVNTQCLGMRINWVICMQTFCFLFSLPRCFPRLLQIGSLSHGCLAAPISATPDLGIRTRLSFNQGAHPCLRTAWSMFNRCSRAKVLKEVTNRKRRPQGFLVDLALWVSNTRSAIAILHGSLAVCHTLVYNIANTRNHPVRAAPLSERLWHVH